MRIILILCAVFAPFAAAAESVMPVATIRSATIITGEMLQISAVTVAGAVTDPRDILGLEARVTLYPNRPIRMQDVGAPTIINRNDIVPLIFNQGGLTITTEARALARAGEGDSIRVMNLTSRTTVFGTVSAQGAVYVGHFPGS